MFTVSPLALLNFKLLLALFLALACLSSVCATPMPAPAPGLNLPLISNDVESSASTGEKPASALALLAGLNSLDAVSALSNVGSGGTGVAASAAGTQTQAQAQAQEEPKPKLQMFSLRGRVVAYRAPSAAAVQKREHRERDEQDADEEEDAQPLKRAERFQLKMMRRGVRA